MSLASFFIDLLTNYCVCVSSFFFFFSKKGCGRSERFSDLAWNYNRFLSRIRTGVRINVWNPPTLNFRSDWSGTTQVQKFWTYTYLVRLNTNALIITRVWNIYLSMVWMFKKNVPKKAHIFNSETLNDCQFSTYNSPSIGVEPQLTKLICFLVRYTIWTVRLDG